MGDENDFSGPSLRGNPGVNMETDEREPNGPGQQRPNVANAVFRATNLEDQVRPARDMYTLISTSSCKRARSPPRGTSVL